MKPAVEAEGAAMTLEIVVVATAVAIETLETSEATVELALWRFLVFPFLVRNNVCLS